MRIDLFLTGAVAYRVKSPFATALFEFFRGERFSPKGIKRIEKSGDICFVLPLREAKRFEAAAAKCGVEIAERAESGVPALWRRLLRRPGLLAGILLGLALFCGARFFLWDIRVTGNERIDAAELERELAAAGLSKGCFLPALDRDGVAVAMREGDARVAYVTVNLKGTVAYVQVRETEPVAPLLPSAPANLVAKCDGVITLPLVFEGECLVTEGQVVRAGQLLASGLIDTQNHGYRVTRSSGQVMARTVHTYTVTVPLSYEQKTYTGEVGREVSLLFFDRTRKVFKNSRNITNDCDIIKTTKWIALPSGKTLPFGFALVRASGYTYLPAARTVTEARRMAVEELDALLAADSAGRVLLQKTTETVADGTGVTLVCTVICEEDIAATVEFVAE